MEGDPEQDSHLDVSDVTFVSSVLPRSHDSFAPASTRAHEGGERDLIVDENNAETLIGASGISTETYDSGNPLEDWNKEEKLELWTCIKAYGSHNIKPYHNYITTKTTDQIRRALDWYKKRALNNVHYTSPERKDKHKKGGGNIKRISRIPLASWAKMLTDSLEFQELQTETATALRLIAEFETPPASLTSQVDFRKIYHLIANAMEGKSLQEDQIASSVLEKCLTETALSSKEFMRYSSLRNVVDQINIASSKDMSYFSQPSLNPEFSVIEYLAGQKNYNPFNIHSSNLIASKLDS